MTRKLAFPWIMAPLLLSACAAHETAPVSVNKPSFPALDAPTRLAQNEGYLPDTLPNPDRRPFYESWFGNQLAAMREPSWAKASPLPDGQFKLRILYLPTFAPAHVVRVEKGETQNAFVKIVGLDGAGGYAPGTIRATEQYDLSDEAVAELENLMAKADLADLLFTDPESFSLCTDGMQLVFELVDEKGHHMVERHQCETKGQLKELALRVDKYRKTAGSDISQYWH